MIFEILYLYLYDYSYGISTIRAKDKKEAEQKFYQDGADSMYDIISIEGKGA